MRSPKPTNGFRRALEDYELDRTDVEASRGAKQTVTNRPFGLTIKFTEKKKGGSQKPEAGSQ